MTRVIASSNKKKTKRIHDHHGHGNNRINNKSPVTASNVLLSAKNVIGVIIAGLSAYEIGNRVYTNLRHNEIEESKKHIKDDQTKHKKTIDKIATMAILTKYMEKSPVDYMTIKNVYEHTAGTADDLFKAYSKCRRYAYLRNNKSSLTYPEYIKIFDMIKGLDQSYNVIFFS